MDLSAMLPLLMKNQGPQAEAMMSALGGGDKSKLFESLLGDNGKNKELLTMLNLMQSQQKTNKPPQRQGLNAVQSIAPSDILGILLKHYSK